LRLTLATIDVVRLEEFDREHRDILYALYAVRLHAQKKQIFGVWCAVGSLMAKQL
jgi:hypothetical protein